MSIIYIVISITLLLCLLALIVILYFKKNKNTKNSLPRLPGIDPEMNWRDTIPISQKYVTQVRAYPYYDNLIFACSRNTGLVIYKMGDSPGDISLTPWLNTNAVGVEGQSLHRDGKTFVCAHLGKANAMKINSSPGFYIWGPEKCNLLRKNNQDTPLDSDYEWSYDYFVDIGQWTDAILHCEFFYHSSGHTYIVASSGFAENNKGAYIIFDYDLFMQTAGNNKPTVRCYVIETHIVFPEGVCLIGDYLYGGGIGEAKSLSFADDMVKISLVDPARPTVMGYVDGVGAQLVPGKKEEYVQPIGYKIPKAERNITYLAAWGFTNGQVLALDSKGKIIGRSGKKFGNKFLNRVIPFGNRLYCPMEQPRGGISQFDISDITNKNTKSIPQRGIAKISASEGMSKTYCMAINKYGVIYLFCADLDKVFVTTCDDVESKFNDTQTIGTIPFCDPDSCENTLGSNYRQIGTDDSGCPPEWLGGGKRKICEKNRNNPGVYF